MHGHGGNIVPILGHAGAQRQRAGHDNRFIRHVAGQNRVIDRTQVFAKTSEDDPRSLGGVPQIGITSHLRIFIGSSKRNQLKAGFLDQWSEKRIDDHAPRDGRERKAPGQCR